MWNGQKAVKQNNKPLHYDLPTCTGNHKQIRLLTKDQNKGCIKRNHPEDMLLKKISWNKVNILPRGCDIKGDVGSGNKIGTLFKDFRTLPVIFHLSPLSWCQGGT